MNAKCITVRYEAGEYYLKNGVKGGATKYRKCTIVSC